MNKKLKLVKAILSASLLVTPFSLLFSQNSNFASASNNKQENKTDNIKIVFSDFYIIIDNYEYKNINIVYSSTIYENIATIIDKNTNRVLEKIYYKKNLIRSYEFSTTLSRDFYFGNSIVKANIDVLVGYSGSFRWIKSLGNSSLYVVKHGGESAWIEGALISPFIDGNDPSRINFSISGTLYVKGDYYEKHTGYYNVGSGISAINITSSSVVSLYWVWGENMKRVEILMIIIIILLILILILLSKVLNVVDAPMLVRMVS